MLLIGLLSFLPGSASSDDAAVNYRKALESGDRNGVYRAASFLAPPNCYDVNIWHGIRFTRMVNGRVGHPRFMFTHQQMDHMKLSVLRERAHIDELEKSSRSEIDLIRKLADWANSQFGHMQPLPFASWDALEVLDWVGEGEAFWCTYKAALFVQACSAAGLTARMLNINRLEKDGHDVAEVYSNELRKWMLVDPWMNFYIERNSIPLSALEIHNSIDRP